MNSYCSNCLFPLDPSEYGSRLCGTCSSVKNEATEGAKRENKDVEVEVANALMTRKDLRRRTAHADSRTPIQRIQRAELEERLKIERGSVNDPRRARLPL